LLALPLLALLLAAPPPDQPRAEALLASPRPIDKAWGAYLAGNQKLTPLIPQLIAELDSLRPIPTTSELERWSLAHTLLDALIRLNAPLAVDQLKPWLDIYRDEALVLLLQGSKPNHLALFEFRPILHGAHWLAVTNQLVHQRAPGIAATLLAETKLTHNFAVWDSEPTGIGGGAGSAFSNLAPTQFASGFPPAARYQLVISPKAGDTLLAPGPRNIYLRRTIIPTDSQLSWYDPNPRLSIQSELTCYSAALAGRPEEEIRRLISAYTAIQWTTPDSFAETALKSLEVQASAIRGLVARFIQSGLLTASELAKIHLQILPKIEDNRRDQSSPLPTIPPYPVDLTNP
jgi:hypothetical protein